MNRKDTNPSANVPVQRDNEPRGDRGSEGKTWSPGDEQGISNREGDENAADRGEGKVSSRTPGQAEGE